MKISSIGGHEREAKLRWFKHVKRIRTFALVWMCEMLSMDSFKRGRDRLKEYWEKVIKQDLVYFQFTEDMTLDNRVWMA